MSEPTQPKWSPPPVHGAKNDGQAPNLPPIPSASSPSAVAVEYCPPFAPVFALRSPSDPWSLRLNAKERSLLTRSTFRSTLATLLANELISLDQLGRLIEIESEYRDAIEQIEVALNAEAGDLEPETLKVVTQLFSAVAHLACPSEIVAALTPTTVSFAKSDSGDTDVWASPDIPDTFDRCEDAIGGVRWNARNMQRSSSERQ